MENKYFKLTDLYLTANRISFAVTWPREKEPYHNLPVPKRAHAKKVKETLLFVIHPT